MVDINIMRRAVFAGSFDPLTLGHLDIIARAASLFDCLIVIAADNPQKRYLFTKEERRDLLIASTRQWEQVTVMLCPEGTLLARFLASIDVRILVRGIRGARDFEQEAEMARMNAHLGAGLGMNIETVFLYARPELSGICSSTVKELARYNADLLPFVPAQVARALRARIAEQREPATARSAV